MINFIVPKIGTRERKSGVYRISFDGGWFYIGSSVNLRMRFHAWKFSISHGVPKNKNVKLMIPHSTSIKFEIIKECINVREMEDDLIKLNWDNPLLLNRCPNSDNNIGRRLPIGQKKQEKIKKPPLVFKKVAQFTMDDKFIRIFNSRNSAAKEIKIKTNKITEQIEGKRKTVKGFKFKYVDEQGVIVEPKKYIRKKVINTMPLFFQIDEKGNKISEFTSLNDASKHTGADPRNIKRVLDNAYRYKTAKGFAFKYADVN